MKVAVQLGLGVCALLCVGWVGHVARQGSEVGVATRALTGQGDKYSNIHRGDYVGPDACSTCHAEHYEQWSTHPHSRMNQDASEESVVGDFSGASAQYGGVRTVFERIGQTFVMSYYQGEEQLRRDRVTRTIGSRLQQAYVGIQIEGPEPPDHPIYRTERALPYVYWFSREQWFPEHFVEQYPEPEYDEEGELSYPTADPYSRGERPWSEGCMLCHNTYAYEFRFSRDYPGRGFADVALDASYTPPPGPSPSQLVRLGVSCESCHFGGREHVTNDREMRYVPASPSLAPRPTYAKAQVLNSICAQCHVAGTLPYPNHASSLNSSEASDMLAGACNSAISCADCHDPHVAGGPGGGPNIPERVSACTDCHTDLSEASAAATHARHDSGTVACVDCHMPRINQGIDAVVRTHRIDSPTNESMLAAGAPNACNLCHLDRSILWTLDQLRDGWGKAVDPDPSWMQFYGADLGQPVGLAWLHHPTPISRLVAADAYARTDLGRAALPELLGILLDPYPQNRMFGLFAVERILGRRLSDDDYTPTAPPPKRARQVDQLRRRLVAASR